MTINSDTPSDFDAYNESWYETITRNIMGTEHPDVQRKKEAKRNRFLDELNASAEQEYLPAEERGRGYNLSIFDFFCFCNLC